MCIRDLTGVRKMFETTDSFTKMKNSSLRPSSFHSSSADGELPQCSCTIGRKVLENQE